MKNVMSKTGPKGPTGPQSKTILKGMAENVELFSRKLDRMSLDINERLARELTVFKSSLSTISAEMEARDAELMKLITKMSELLKSINDLANKIVEGAK